MPLEGAGSGVIAHCKTGVSWRMAVVSCKLDQMMTAVAVAVPDA